MDAIKSDALVISANNNYVCNLISLFFGSVFAFIERDTY